MTFLATSVPAEDPATKSVGTNVTVKDDSDNAFLFCDIEDSDDDDTESEYESDSDDDSDYDSDDDSDDEVEAAELMLKNLQMRKSQLTFGSMGDLRFKPPAEVKSKFAERAEKRVQGAPQGSAQGLTKGAAMPKVFSAADLQQLMTHFNPEQAERRPQLNRSHTSALELSSMVSGVGHIGQTTSAQAVTVADNATKPDDHLAKLLGGNPTFFANTDQALDGFFLPNSELYKKAWVEELTKAVRDNDLATLEAMHRQGQLLQACNQFGESIIHLAVRRSSPEVLRFLLQDAGVSMRVRCDLGRSPVHDAAWCLASNPKSYQMMALLLNESPMQVLIKDNRGYTPLQYVPRAKWAECNDFLDRQYKKGRFASLMMN